MLYISSNSTHNILFFKTQAKVQSLHRKAYNQKQLWTTPSNEVSTAWGVEVKWDDIVSQLPTLYVSPIHICFPNWSRSYHS